MRKTALFLVLLAFVACGGNSQSVGGNRGNKNLNGGSAGTNATGGAGGTSGAGATAGQVGNGGSTVDRGGAGGSAGTRTGDAGEPGSAGEGSGAVGGTGGSGATSGTSGDGGSAAMPAITSCTDEFAFVGTWEGHILDFYFATLEDLRLVVTSDAELGGYQATLTWGSGEPPPPVRSGDEPYPSAEFWQDVDDLDGVGSIEPWLGFGYSVVRGAGCDRVFRVSVSVAEPWDEWCSLQTPQCTAEGCGCIYPGGGSSSSTTCDVQDGRGNVLGTYPLWKCQMCGRFENGVCECNETSCTFNHRPTHTFELELAQSGGVDVLSGPDPDQSCDRCTVRLERVE